MRFVLASLFCTTIFAATPPEASRLLGNLPIRFEPRPGSNAGWTAHGPGYSFSFNDRETLLRAGDRTVRLTFPGSHPSRFEGADAAVSTNYFHGKSAVTVPSFHRL